MWMGQPASRQPQRGDGKMAAGKVAVGRAPSPPGLLGGRVWAGLGADHGPHQGTGRGP